jgi:glycosyltransferase involved in cell wall biosynthesis
MAGSLGILNTGLGNLHYPDAMPDSKPIVLVPVRYFLPAYKAGGPVRTLMAMVEHLSSSYQFKVVALDRDLGDRSPFPGIDRAVWNSVKKTQVRYLSPGVWLAFRLIRVLRETKCDILYLNSFFDPKFTLVPLIAWRLGLIRAKSVILAPRGELSPGALAQKRLKKRIFLNLALRLGLYKNIMVHASADLEKSEIQRALALKGGDSGIMPPIRVARNLASLDKLEIRVARDLASIDIGTASAHQAKAPGQLKAVFLSRISPKKNLAEAIRLLGRVDGTVTLHIYGPIDDRHYWQKCQQLAGEPGSSLAVEYKGSLPHEQVLKTLSNYHAFVFPTLSENFGHAILEALLAGCPVVTSDQTPWRNLAAQSAGWDLPLQAADKFVEVLQGLADMGENEHRVLREGAIALGSAALHDESAIRDNQQLFSATHVG